MKNILIISLTVVLFGLIAVYMLLLRPTGTEYSNKGEENNEQTDSMSDAEADSSEDAMEEVVDDTKTLIGKSVEGRDIMAYHFGTGEKEILFVGGIHGGYSANTSELMYELKDYLESGAEIVPENVKVTVVPLLNPDGLTKLVANPDNKTAARFNANNVDLNRNFDCDWTGESTWRSQSVSGGDAAFSEPEAEAIRAYVENHQIAGAVVYYSAAGGVYSSSCRNGITAETKELTKLYAEAANYKSYQEFDSYDINGDMVNWLAKLNIPAISVLLTTHESVEWDRNRAGIEAIFDHYNK